MAHSIFFVITLQRGWFHWQSNHCTAVDFSRKCLNSAVSIMTKFCSHKLSDCFRFNKWVRFSFDIPTYLATIYILTMYLQRMKKMSTLQLKYYTMVFFFLLIEIKHALNIKRFVKLMIEKCLRGINPFQGIVFQILKTFRHVSFFDKIVISPINKLAPQ